LRGKRRRGEGTNRREEKERILRFPPSYNRVGRGEGKKEPKKGRRKKDIILSSQRGCRGEKKGGGGRGKKKKLTASQKIECH